MSDTVQSFSLDDHEERLGYLPSGEASPCFDLELETEAGLAFSALAARSCRSSCPKHTFYSAWWKAAVVQRYVDNLLGPLAPTK